MQAICNEILANPMRYVSYSDASTYASVEDYVARMRNSHEKLDQCALMAMLTLFQRRAEIIMPDGTVQTLPYDFLPRLIPQTVRK
jgi:hypothetical protein